VLGSGTRVGRYELLGLLGSGGMGEVYRARDPRLRRDVAIKLLPAALARDEARLKWFRHEAQLAGGLDHPNVLTVHDLGMRRGAPYLVTELLDGQTLRQRLIGGALPMSHALDYAAQMARGLAAAHERGIVHRDLKPENVFVTRDGRVKILDFGIAKLTQVEQPPPLPSRAETPSCAELPIGTAGYTSPEQARGEAVDHRCDIFSFGVVLYEMLSGRRAFQGESVVETLHAVLRDEPPRLSEVTPAAPESVDRLVRRCLEKRREDRFQSAHDLALALEALAGVRPGPPTPGAEGAAPLGPSGLSASTPPHEPVRAEATPGGTAVVGRDKELADLEGHLTRALCGRGRVVFITGEAGTGKTVLAGAFARRSQRDCPGLVVAGGGCNAHTGIGDPYLPFREILELLTGDVEARRAAGSLPPGQAEALTALIPVSVAALVESGPDLVDTFLPGAALLVRARAAVPEGAAWLGELGRLVEHRPSAAETTPPVQASLFAQYTRVVQEVSRHRPLLLFLDDLQWADSGTIGLLFHIGRQIGGSRVLVVGLFRPSDVALGREGARHPLEPVVHELERVFGDVAVELGEGEDRGFVEALLDTESNRLDDRFRESLTHQTGGNPLFTVELLRDLQERSLVRKDEEGRWVAGAGLSWALLPARVEAVIAERIGRLRERLRRILAVASVEGEEFTAEAVSRVVGVDEGELVRLLGEELDRRHHLVRARGLERRGEKRLSRYRFRHFLFAHYLYGRLDDVDRARLHESLGTALEELHGEASGEVAVELARHFREAGVWGKAVDYGQEAGRRAKRASAYHEAEGHFRMAVELVGRLSPETDRAHRELELQVDLAWATFFARGYGAEGAARALRRARELCGPMGERSLDFRLAMSLCVYRWCRAEHAESLELAEEALVIAKGLADDALLVMAHATLGTVLAHHGRLAMGRAHIEEALARHERSGHSPRIVPELDHDPAQVYCSILGRFLWYLGYPQQAARRSREGEDIARGLSHPHSLAHAAYFAGMVHLLRRDVRAVRECVWRLHELSSEWPFPVWVAGARVLKGWCTAQEGRFWEGLGEMRGGLEGWRGAGLEIDTPTFLGLMADACAASGRVEEGHGFLHEALAAVSRTGERVFEAEFHRLVGSLWTCASPPRPDEAERSFRHALEVAREQEARSWELRAATSLARLLVRFGREDEARATLSEVYGWFTEGLDTPDLQDARALLDDLSR
jgi:predicted ATPase